MLPRSLLFCYNRWGCTNKWENSPFNMTQTRVGAEICKFWINHYISQAFLVYTISTLLLNGIWFHDANEGYHLRTIKSDRITRNSRHKTLFISSSMNSAGSVRSITFAKREMFFFLKSLLKSYKLKNSFKNVFSKIAAMPATLWYFKTIFQIHLGGLFECYKVTFNQFPI